MKADNGQAKAAATLASYAERIEKALTAYIPDCPYPESIVAEAMAYSLLGGGKRVRGALLLAFYALYHEDVTPAMPFACALEMVHAYSLIHDDLPCMDDDATRRGKPSCHIAYGEAVALLAGDALLTFAFEVMADPVNYPYFQDESILRAIRTLANGAGLFGMIGGQAVDLAQEGKTTPTVLLDRMYAQKTGALLEAAATIGCELAGAGGSETAAALDYAGHMGFAYQILDDILDVTGDEAVLGKPQGSDARKGKSTYVGQHGMEKAKQEAARLHEQAKKALAGLPGDTGFLAGLADILAGRQS